jgi:branched-chain amino acid transport system ATP-binding protein
MNASAAQPGADGASAHTAGPPTSPGREGPALAARGLNKRFGSLVVARDVAFDLPRGARYALIGPNGAGKTTLINLLTGMLRPDGGEILLDGEVITSLGPAARVKRGLARTFQINTLFPNLSPLESVTLAVCERAGWGAASVRSLPACRGAIEEAYGLLKSVNLAADCDRPTRELAYGQQRLLEMALALAVRPRVLLLDEPAAGVPRDESAALLAAISNLPQEISVLFIEHDMSLVFRFASRIIVMVGGGILVEGPPGEIARDARVREVYLGTSGHG